MHLSFSLPNSASPPSSHSIVGMYIFFTMLFIVTPTECAIAPILLMKKLRLGQAGHQW